MARIESTAGADPGLRRGRRVFVSRRVSSPPWLVPLGYLAAISLAESLTVLVEPRLGLAMHGIVLLALLLHASRTQHVRDRRFLLALSLAPLIRLLSMSLPLSGRPLIEWYSLIGILLFVAVFFALRATELGRRRIGLILKGWPLQCLIGFTGIGLGLLEYYILKPDPLAPSLSWGAIWLPALVLFVFTGLLEEIIFRGMIQQASLPRLGRSGWLYVAILFAVLHLGYRSAADVLFVFIVGLAFGLIVLRTGSIMGVSLAHGLTNVSLYLIFPFLLAPMETPPLPAEMALEPFPPVSAIVTSMTETPSLTATATPVEITPSATPLKGTSLDAAPTVSAETTEPAITPTPIMVDDGDAGFEALDGQWWIEPDGIGGDLHWSFTIATAPNVAAEWRPVFNECGLYEVEVYLPREYSTTRAARYVIEYRDGVEQVVLDQAAHQGQWTGLGAYTFAPSEGAILRLTNQTGEDASLGLIVAFDAARWSFIGPCGLP